MRRFSVDAFRNASSLAVLDGGDFSAFSLLQSSALADPADIAPIRIVEKTSADNGLDRCNNMAHPSLRACEYGRRTVIFDSHRLVPPHSDTKARNFRRREQGLELRLA